MSASKYLYSMELTNDAEALVPFWRLADPSDQTAVLLCFWERPGGGFQVGVRSEEQGFMKELVFNYQEVDAGGMVYALKEYGVPPPERAFCSNNYRQRRDTWLRESRRR